jgi:hypothetical protein
MAMQDALLGTGEFDAALTHWMADAPARISSGKGYGQDAELQRRIVRSAGEMHSRAWPTDALLKAARIAPEDADCLRLYLSAYYIAHRGVMAALSDACGTRVALHISCVPRLALARRARESLSKASDFTSIICVGVGRDGTLHFDPTERVLSVPVEDSYEDLSEKVFYALSVLSFLPQVASVLKIDDDSRLRSSALLAQLATEAERDSTPSVFGRRHVLSNAVSHFRAWHAGKCSRAALNEEAFSVHPPPEFAQGGPGYLVNRAALRVLHYHRIYFPEQIRMTLYEDMAVANALINAGGGVRNVNISGALEMVEVD